MAKSHLLLLTSSIFALTVTAQDYVTNFTGENITHASRYTSAIYLNGSADGDQTLETGQKLKGSLYWLITDNCLSARPGETLYPTFGYSGSWMNGYVYIDYNNDGVFDYTINDNGTPAAGSELVAYSHYKGKDSTGKAGDSSKLLMPTFTLPSDLAPGIYRVRYKIDWDCIDPAGNTNENNTIIKNGGIIADAMLVVHTDETASLKVTTDGNGKLLAADRSELPPTITSGAPLQVAVAANDDYKLDYITVHHAFDAPATHGNINEWTVTLTRDQLRMNSNTISGNCTVGDNVEINAYFAEKGLVSDGADKYKSKGYELVWCDEFNQEDGTQPDFETKWIHSPRRSSTWNKRNSSREDLYEISDGILHLYAKPNDDTTTDSAPMLTAAMETTGKFAFTYGIVEARVQVNPHTGNFPAFWMMPEDGSFNGGWPFCGEIDIMEQIDNEQRTYHTLHAHWTNDKSTKVTSTYYTNVAEWHNYTLEWTPEGLVWYVDGNETCRYKKSSYASTKYAYPFDRKFHIIINQAVGDGSWAKAFDPTHTYMTAFDYVRVYQKDDLNGIETVTDTTPSVAIQPIKQGAILTSANPVNVNVYNLSGMLITSVDVAGIVQVPLSSGFYIIDNQKVMIH